MTGESETRSSAEGRAVEAESEGEGAGSAARLEPGHRLVARRKGRGRRTLLVICSAGLILLLVLAVIVLHPFASTPSSTKVASVSAAAPVVVRRSDITPVVTLDATVVARPSYSVATPREGVVTRGSVPPGGEVRAGSPLYSVGGVSVPAKTDCIVGQWLTDGVKVPAGLPVVSCTYPGFGLTAKFPPDNAYTILSGVLAGRGQITNGPGPFDCPILIAPSTAMPSGPQDSSGPPAPAAAAVTVVCAVPAGVRGLEGVGALVAVRSTLVANALVLPRSAVAGSVDTGQVNLLVDGRDQSRQVKLGATDGNVVQIVSGLHDGDRVSPNPPSVGGS